VSDNPVATVDEITALLHLVDKLATSLLRTHILLTSCEIFTCVDTLHRNDNCAVKNIYNDLKYRHNLERRPFVGKLSTLKFCL
jgi:hypothetical protein